MLCCFCISPDIFPTNTFQEVVEEPEERPFSLSDVDLLSLATEFLKCEELFSALFAVFDCIPCNLGAGLFASTLFLVQRLSETFFVCQLKHERILGHLLDSLGE